MTNTSLILYSLWDRKFTIPFNNSDWTVNYAEGDLIELNRKLLLSETKYPIIWLQTGYGESYRKNGGLVTLSGCNFFLITKGDTHDLYKKRYQTNYQQMLIPLFNKFLDSLAKSKGVSILNDEISYMKLPFNDVSELTARDSQNGRKRLPETSTVPDIWDAIAVRDIDLRIKIDCYPEFNI